MKASGSSRCIALPMPIGSRSHRRESLEGSFAWAYGPAVSPMLTVDLEYGLSSDELGDGGVAAPDRLTGIREELRRSAGIDRLLSHGLELFETIPFDLETVQLTRHASRGPPVEDARDTLAKDQQSIAKDQ